MVRPLGICALTDSLLRFTGESSPALIDLSKATKLKEVVFWPRQRSVEWVIMALQTITPEHQGLEQITIRTPDYFALAAILPDFRNAVGEAQCGLWLDLDRLLVQLWESRSIRPKVVYTTGQGKGDPIESLLPGITERRIVDLVECPSA
jgi:hypothetical protein